MADIKYARGSITSLATTALNSLAAAARVAGSTFDNGDSANLFIGAGFELVVTFGTGPTAGTMVELYLLPSLDGTNFADGSSSVAPATIVYAGGFPVRSVTTSQRIIIPRVSLEPFLYTPLLINSTNQAFAGGGVNSLKIFPYRLQST